MFFFSIKRAPFVNIWVLYQLLFGYFVRIFWGIMSALVWVLFQHLFGYFVSICLGIMSAFVCSIRSAIA